MKKALPLLAFVLAPAAAAQTTHYTAPSAQGGAFFGLAVAGMKDQNGDTRGDVIVGAPYEDMPNGFINCGRVYVYLGLTNQLQLTINPPNKQPGGLFGHAVAGLDNIDGDTRGDIIVGAPRQHPGATPLNAGRCYLFKGVNGAMIRAHKSPVEQAGSLFGWAVAAVPDVNGDGRTEYVISAPGETVGGKAGGGRVYLFNGANGVLLDILWSPVFEAGGNFGWSVAGVPDATGDGKGDILVGAPREDPGAAPTDAGRVFLFNGATGAFVKVFGSPFQEAGGRFGWSVSGVPDANGDGRGDILIGAPGDSPGNSPVRSGRAYMYSGATGGYLRTLFSPNNQSTGEFGTVVSGVADLTGDGRGDVIVSAPRETANLVVRGGRVYVYNGSTGALVSTLTSPNNQIDGYFGMAMSGTPDVNFNSRGDVLVGAPYEDTGNPPLNIGRAYLIRH